MTLMNTTDGATAARRSSDRLTVAIMGGGPRAASLLRLLSEVDNLDVAAVCAPQALSPTLRLAEELGVFATRDHTEVFQIPGLSLIIDMSEDPRFQSLLQAQRPAHIEVVGMTGSELVWDLLVAKKRGEEQERLFVELQVAYDKIRSHERRLQTSKEDLERANEELESRLAEIFFTHEFFKALTSFTSVDDVCSLIVDGCNGILGAEISCVYLFNREDWTLHLRASQGRPQEAFRHVVPVSETVLGYAFREGAIQEVDIEPAGPSTAWATPECDVRSQAAVPLRTGDNVFGVMIMASSGIRELSAAESERLAVLGNQSSLSLQNALLHGELEMLSVTDRLTELYNHGYFQQRLDEEFKRSRRFGHTMSLIMLDIDDFKQFNDTYGHPKGDTILRAVSAVIRSNLREMDIAARYGGEEFVILLPETEIEGALSVAERVRAGVEMIRVEELGPDTVAGTVSVGVSSFPAHAGTALRLLESADASMYRAKRAGKNRVTSA